MGQGQSKIKRRYLSNTSINRVNHPYKTQQQCEQSEKSENSSSASSNQSAQYWIPIDDQEIDRLHQLNFVLKEEFGGSVMSSAKHCIREGARILDVGCGPGTWVLDAATDYPEADWVGIDINGMFPEMIMPPNVSFVQADVLDGLPFEAGTFDLVQMRLTTFAWTCEEWPIVIGDIFRVLKPGGYIQTIDIGREHSDGPSDPPDPEILKFNYKLAKFIESQGQDLTPGNKLAGWQKQSGFQVVQEEVHKFPLGWGGRIGEYMLDDVRQSFLGSKPLLLKNIMEEVNEADFENYVESLLQKCALFKSHMTYYTVVGYKPNL